MAMTKAEQAAMEALKVRCALAWPPLPPKPIDTDVALAASETGWARAWWFNAYAKAVGEGVFTSGLHALHRYTDQQMTTQHSAGSRVSMSQTRGGPWYATKADALAALHYAVAQECAKLLRSVERQIEAATTSHTSP